MQTVYEAAGGADGLLRLANSWHARVMADEVVSHAFSHGFHPEHSQRLAAYWGESLGGPTTYTNSYGDETSVVRLHSGPVRTQRWTSERSSASIMHWPMSLSPVSRWDECCTTTLRGRPRPRCPDITAQQMMFRAGCAFRSGRGTDSSVSNRSRSGPPHFF